MGLPPLDCAGREGRPAPVGMNAFPEGELIPPDAADRRTVEVELETVAFQPRKTLELDSVDTIPEAADEAG